MRTIIILILTLIISCDMNKNQLIETPVEEPSPTILETEDRQTQSPVVQPNSSRTLEKKEAKWAKRYHKKVGGLKTAEEESPLRGRSNKVEAVPETTTSDKKKFWEK